MITFEIPGRFNTTAQQKGVTIKYGKPYFYEKPEVKALRNQLYFYCKPHRPPQPFGGAVRLKVIFYYKTTKKKQIGQFKTTRPDLDNLNKLLWDVLTETGFFKDDSQIVIFEARKGYGEEDKIKIEIDEINEEGYERAKEYFERLTGKCEKCDYRKFTEKFVDGIVEVMKYNGITSVEQLQEILKGAGK